MTFRMRITAPLLAIGLVFAATSATEGRDFLAQDPQQNPAQANGAFDPIEQLRLTPEQRQQIRLIAEQSKDERQLSNRRLREANIALEQALDAEPIDENLIEQRVNEVATAQAAQMRMRIQMELKIRRVLHPEQLATLRRLRLQVRDVMGGQRPNQRRPVPEGMRPNQGNGIAPQSFPRSNVPSRNPRP